MSDEEQNLLHDFTPHDDWAREHRTTIRTVGRLRAQGLPWVLWNGEVHIGPNAEARDCNRGSGMRGN